MSVEQPAQPPAARFLSLRWRLVFPLAAAVMVAAMLGAYLITGVLTDDYAVAEENILLQSGAAVIKRASDHYARLRAEAQRIAYTQGVVEGVQARQSASLHGLLESMAQLAHLDSVVLTDTNGREVVGLVRVVTPELADYAVSANTDLSAQPLVQRVLAGAEEAAAFMRTSEGLMVYVAVPLRPYGDSAGVVLVGQTARTALAELQASAVTELLLFTTDGVLAGATLDVGALPLAQVTLDDGIRAQVLNANMPVKGTLTLDGLPYRALYAPLRYHDALLGVVVVLLPNNVPFASETGRQLTALFASVLAGVAVAVVFAGAWSLTRRLGRVTATAQALAGGDLAARANMASSDEIGVLAQSLDRFAQQTQDREDKLRTMLRRERRERAYLLAVLESLPMGVLVQDETGALLMMNEQARALLGTQTNFQPALGLQEAVNAVLGDMLAPGIYALGKPQQVAHDGAMLSAQLAAVLSPAKERLGTVILLRDITEEVQQIQARESILQKLAVEVEQPLFTLARENAANDFAREISRHAASLQKMIVDMRELTRYNRNRARAMQRPLAVETLLWAVANDWRQIAQAAQLSLNVLIAREGLFVLGDESRLRLALGNLVDNAIKYTPAGGTVLLEIHDEVASAVHLRVRDNGVGISAADLPHVFMPFYRGTPVTADGQLIRVPGMGQGLPLAKSIIEAHGGVMRVKSKPGVGTAVYIALPLTSGISYNLPRVDYSALEGDTVVIPENVDIEQFWRGQ